MKSPQTAAIILARGGSKGIPGKNLKPIGGQPLVVRSVKAALQADGVHTVWVSTDDAEIAQVAIAAGARIIKRSDDLANDNSSSEEGWLHAVSEIRAAGMQPELLVFLQCTSPFTTGADIDACLIEMDRSQASTVLSVVNDHSFLWSHDDHGMAVGTNHDLSAPRKRRQDLQPSFRESGAVYVVETEAFLREKNRFCQPVAVCPIDHPPIEIDSTDDLEAAQYFARRRIQATPSKLSHIRALVMDFDGVHTDDLVHTTQDGSELVVTSRRDGMGLSRLRSDGRCEMLILSKERNCVVLARARKLQIEAMNEIDDKVATLEGWLMQRGLSWEQTAFIGNDVNDLSVLHKAGLSICPADAHDSVLSSVDWILPAPGGRGALRHLCDELLAAQG